MAGRVLVDPVPECIGDDEHHDEESKEEDDQGRQNVSNVLCTRKKI